MTYEKARDLLAMIEVKEPNELIVNSWWGSFVKDYREALQIAIKALEQQPCDDCISRQAVLALPTSKTRTLSGEIVEEEVDIKLIKALPSVTPKEKTCEDAVSRQAVKQVIIDSIADLEYTCENQEVQNLIDDLPPVTPKEKTGHWILTDVEGNKVWHCNCSECGKDPQDYIGGSENWWMIKNKLPKYCPNCGKKIQEVEE